MPRHAAQRPAAHDTTIPDKLYFRIGEVAKLCGVETYVLRFWETEFPQLRPNKSGTGQRLYRKREVELALRVRRLLHDEGYTIAGARQVLAHDAGKGRSPQPETPDAPTAGEPASPGHSTALAAKIQHLRAEMRELLGMLSTEPSSPDPSSADPRTSGQRHPGLTLTRRGDRKPRPAPGRGPTLFE